MSATANFGDELNLLYFCLLNAAVFAGAWCFASRCMTRSRSQALLDAALLGYGVQYVAVSLPGLVRHLNFASIAGTAAICVLVLISVAWRHPRHRYPIVPAFDRYFIGAIVLFTAGMVLVYAHSQASLPILSNDALTYHFPAAVQWLQRGKIDLFQTWFFNPANTWSPLAGSIFIAWLMAPFGSDVMARFVEVPALFCVGIAMVRLCREMGERITVAVAIAAASILARPIFLPCMMGKDDLFVAFFFIAILVALSPDRFQERLGPMRLGIALGLLLATKYTALMIAPVLCLAIDGMWRASPSPGTPEGSSTAGGSKGDFERHTTPGTRNHPHPNPLPVYRERGPEVLAVSSPSPGTPGGSSIVGGSEGDFERKATIESSNRPRPAFSARRPLIALTIAAAIAGPWYLRNWIVTGNPIFPMFSQFTTSRSEAFHPWLSAMHIVLGGAYGLPLVLAIPLIIGWGVSLSKVRAGPLQRACSLGAPIGLLIFFGTSPFPEIRFVLPMFLLAFACTAVAIQQFARGEKLSLSIAVLLLIGSLGTMFEFRFISVIVQFVGLALGLTLVGLLVAKWAGPVRLRWIFVCGISTASLFVFTYINWKSYCRNYRESLFEDGTGYAAEYRETPLWRFVNEHLPADAIVAYSNTYLVYPLQGSDLRRQLIYVPTRPGVNSITDLGWIGRRLSGEQLVNHTTLRTIMPSDIKTWLDNLAKSHAQFLVISSGGVIQGAELGYAQNDSVRFTPLFESEAGSVYRINR